MENGDQISFSYGRPSTCLWEDEVGDTQEIPQGEGGEQGNPPHAIVVFPRPILHLKQSRGVSRQ